MSNLIEQAIQRAFMGFPIGSMNENQPMMLFELALERAILGMPSSDRFGPPRYDFLLHRRNGSLGALEE